MTTTTANRHVVEFATKLAQQVNDRQAKVDHAVEALANDRNLETAQRVMIERGNLEALQYVLSGFEGQPATIDQLDAVLTGITNDLCEKAVGATAGHGAGMPAVFWKQLYVQRRVMMVALDNARRDA